MYKKSSRRSSRSTSLSSSSRRKRVMNAMVAKRKRGNSSLNMMVGSISNYTVKQGELKCMDRDLANSRALVAVGACVASDTVLTTGWVQLNNLQCGPEAFKRVGQKVNNQSLHVTFTLLAAGLTFNDIGLVRYIIIHDKSPNGSFPVIGDVFSSIDNAGAETTQFNSSVKLANKDRFTILRDKYVALDAGQGVYFECKEYIKLKGIQSQYKSTTNPGAIADCVQGAFYFMIFSQGGAGTTISNFNSRLRYVD